MIDWGKIGLKELAGYVTEELRKRGIDTILVGGACVTIYSENRYQSYDLDYITYEDRLSAFYHWNDRQGLEQAVNICQEQDIDLSEVERWSQSESMFEKYKIFLERLKNIKPST